MSETRCIFLTGSNRSGTTWLQDILAHSLNCRLLFEPLHPRVSERPDFVRLYLTARDENPELEAYLHRVLDNRVHDRWMRQGGHASPLYFFRHRWWARKTVVKLVRANLMLDWLSPRFDARIIYLIRHPCAVISSMRKMGWEESVGWSFDFLKTQEALMRNFTAAQQARILDPAATNLERLTMLWCIENMIPLRQFNQNNWIGVVYEELVANPVPELNRIHEALGWTPPRKGYPGVHRISHTAARDTRDTRDVLHKWKKGLTEEEAETILRLVAEFGCVLYNDQSAPRFRHLEELPREVGCC